MSDSRGANVVKVRFVVHTLGLRGWDKSRNHWSIYLILPGEQASVRLSMHLESGDDDYGTFVISNHSYAFSNSLLTYFDYAVPPSLVVGQFLNLVYQNRRDRYIVTDSGNGCRFWVWTIFQDFVRAGFVTNVMSTTVQDFGSRMQLRYHRNADGTIFTSPDEMEIGEFV